MKRAICVALLPWSIALGQGAAESFKAGRAALDANNADAAEQAFEKAIAAEPNRAEYHLWLARAVGTQAINANTLRQPFLARRAKAEFEKTVQLDPANIGGREGMMQFYLFAPGVMGGSLAKARSEAEAIAKVSALRGYLARARIANYGKDVAGYERELRGAYAAFPDSAAAFGTLAGFLIASNHTDEAQTTVDRYLARRPGDITGLLWAGRVAIATGTQLERGDQALRAVIASPQLGMDGMPSAATAHLGLGQLLAKKGAKGEARKEFETVLQLNPRSTAAKKALAELKS